MKKNKPILAAIVLFAVITLFSIKINAQYYNIVAYSDNTMDHFIKDSGSVLFYYDNTIINNNPYQAKLIVDYSTTDVFKQGEGIAELTEAILVKDNDSINVLVLKVEYIDHAELAIFFDNETRFNYYLRRK